MKIKPVPYTNFFVSVGMTPIYIGMKKTILTLFMLFLMYCTGQSIYLLIQERNYSASLEKKIRYCLQNRFTIINYYKSKNLIK